MVELKYIIKVTISKTMRSFSYEEEFAVIQPYDKEVLKDKDEPISMNVGIKDLLSILIELNHINYSIHGTLKGTVTFGKVNLMLTKMEIQLIKKEKIYGYNNKTQKNISEKIVATYELIDGGPYKNETIPFRLFLSPYNLTPTYIDIASYFSSRYFLNLVIKDQENNKYFKQKEIFLFRLYINPINEIKNNNIEHLKNFITEPIDYGDYFSSFNDIEEKEEKEEKNLNNLKEPEPQEFYFRSSLKGFIEDNNDKDYEEENDEFKINIKNRSNSVFIFNNNTNIFETNENNDININIENNNYYYDDNLVIQNKKKSSSVKINKNKKQNKVINIKEKNKYKNNDILINDNYYNADNYIIYENSYNNIFDNKLKTNRIKENLKENKNINNNINNKEKNSDDLIININNDTNNINNEIDDQKLFFPDEPFSNSLILNNLPSNYGSIRDDDDDFRKNLMGQRIKKEK